MECGKPLAAGSPALVCGACLLGEGPEEPVLRVPGHEVLEELARGGMGVVYRARERETQRTVALKMLRPRLADEEGMRERFRMEAAAAAALHHPGILPVYRVDESEAMPFFTMKLAAGGTLAERRGEFAGKWREIAGLMVSLCGAVQYAHQHGVLHRDVKPGNVLFDEEGRAYLADFGLVKLIDGVSELTGSQSFLGTPHYSAPEVAAGNAGSATVASDVWSLGAVLYELLNGRVPFDAPGLAPLLRKIAEEAPGAFEPGVPGDLRVMALKCLHKEPGQRYESAAALGADLQAWLEGRPIKARAASVPERLWAWAKRNPGLASLTAALAVSLILLGAVLWRGYVASRLAAEEARAGEAAARLNEAESFLKEVRAQLRDGQWVNREALKQRVQRAHQLNPNGGAGDVMASLLALPELQPAGSLSYDRKGETPGTTGAVWLSGDFSRYAARAGNATEVRDAKTHAVIAKLPVVPLDAAGAGPFSRDGKLLAITAAGGVGLWDVEKQRKLAAVPAGLWPLTFSHDGRVAACGRRVLRFSDNMEVQSLDLADTEYTALALAPDGKSLLTAQRGRLLLRLVDTATGALLREYQLAGRSTTLCAAWAGNGINFCTGTTDGRLVRWNTLTPEPEWIIPAHTDGVEDIALFDEDRHLISVGRDGLTKMWDLHAQNPVAALPLSGLRAQVSQDGRMLALDAAAARETQFLKFTPAPGCSLVRLPASYMADRALLGKGAVIPAADGKTFAVTAGTDIQLLDREGTILRSIPSGQCSELLTNPSGDGFLRLRRVRAGDWQLMRVPSDEAEDLGSLAWKVADWKAMPVLAADALTKRFLGGIGDAVLEIEPGTGVKTPRTPELLPPGGRLTAMAFSPCGRYFAWAGVESRTDAGRRVHLMDAAMQHEIRIIPQREAPRLMAFTPDGDSLITGNNGTIQCLDVTTGRELWVWRHSRAQEPTLKTPLSVAIAAGTGTVALLIGPGRICLVDRVTGKARLSLNHPLGQTLRAIGLSPDGTRLVAVGSYVAQVWRLDVLEEALLELGMTLK